MVAQSVARVATRLELNRKRREADQRFTVLLGTWNPAKQGEAAPAAGWAAGVRPDAGRGRPGEAGDPEEGWTFLDNADHKARTLARQRASPAIASDGGLEVPALRGTLARVYRAGGSPVRETRTASPALLELMRGYPGGAADGPLPRGRGARGAGRAPRGGGPVYQARTGASPSAPTRAGCPGSGYRPSGSHPPRWVTEWDLDGMERENLGPPGTPWPERCARPSCTGQRDMLRILERTNAPDARHPGARTPGGTGI